MATTFNDLLDNIKQLSKAELEELKHVVEQKWVEIRRAEILEAAAAAKQESKDGKTIVLSSPEEIKGYFEKMMVNED
jgi:ribosomal protein L7/L12